MTHSPLNEDDVVLIDLPSIIIISSEASNNLRLRDSRRDTSRLACTFGQLINEYTKTTYFTKALEDDPQGRKAAMIFVLEHPFMIAGGRTFVALFATVILHAPTIVITTTSLGYTNTTSITTPASAAWAARTAG